GERTGPRADRGRGGGPGRLHERPLAGLRGTGVSPSLLIVLSVAEAVVLVVVLALALIEIRRRLSSIASDLDDLGAALSTVEEEHLRPLRPAVEAINAQFDGIVGLMPSVAKKAAVVAEHAGRR